MNSFNTVLYSILGERIRKRREEKEISQIDLSNKISLGRTSISNIEKGRQQPPLHVIYSICDAIDIDVQSLLPTSSEVKDRYEKSVSNTNEIVKHLEKYDVSDITIKQIEEYIKKLKS